MQDLATSMAVAKSLGNYKRSNSYKEEDSEDNHYGWRRRGVSQCHQTGEGQGALHSGGQGQGAIRQD